ncbi:hypothetical protein Phage2-1_00037 [Achromobacter phage 2-1]|nr:hypothetical protein Phage2-1_00037 [Achromobacter phage 2-1]
MVLTVQQVTVGRVGRCAGSDAGQLGPFGGLDEAGVFAPDFVQVEAQCCDLEAHVQARVGRANVFRALQGSPFFELTNLEIRHLLFLGLRFFFQYHAVTRLDAHKARLIFQQHTSKTNRPHGGRISSRFPRNVLTHGMQDEAAMIGRIHPGGVRRVNCENQTPAP